MGETSSVYDAGLSVWREKLRNSRIRPPTVVEHIYGDNMVTIDGGKTVKGSAMQATVRIMPHSEWPSGSSSVCQAIEEFVNVAWPKMNLAGGAYSTSTQVLSPSAMMPLVPFTPHVNPATNGYTSA